MCLLKTDEQLFLAMTELRGDLINILRLHSVLWNFVTSDDKQSVNIKH